jgi:hypothetical protein
MSRDSVDGVAKRYGLDGPGIDLRWGEVFRIRPDQLWSTPEISYALDTGAVFPRGKVL